MVTDATLSQLDDLLAACDPGPWVAMIEGRDMLSGDSFIQTGLGDLRGEDIYVTRDSGPASTTYLDLIALMRTALPELIKEIRESRQR